MTNCDLIILNDNSKVKYSCLYQTLKECKSQNDGFSIHTSSTMNMNNHITYFPSDAFTSQ